MHFIYPVGITLIGFMITAMSEARSKEACLEYYHNIRLIQEMPDQCSGLSYCDVIHPDYPKELIDCLLKNKYQVLLATKKQILEKYSGRWANVGDQLDCKVDQIKDLLYEIVDDNNNVRVVVQSDRLKQNIYMERCLDPGKITEATSHLTEDLLTTHNFSCNDTMLPHQLLVLSRDWRRLEFTSVKGGIPVACVCRYTSSE